jgi:hypothetical protein
MARLRKSGQNQYRDGHPLPSTHLSEQVVYAATGEAREIVGDAER